MTAEGRFLIRTWRDKTRRRHLRSQGFDIELAEHLPPINERGRHGAFEEMQRKRERRRAAERMEALAA